ncbi:MAG TPA: PH domain-containing protein [Xylanibacter oryzae]|uniref:PH domain-containing protein n=1 Tax=Xylanibacter oryzae TaxID=185293 RepID=UPI00056C2C03|nr:PH domain-containing protein [Xylanibacter oryzae]HRN16549.1 PH domain-containing protein [Xylanibacter oryzae]
MDRLFHQRFTLASKCGITILTLLAGYLLWMRSAANALLGFVVVIILVVIIERVIHTVYIFTSAGNLVIDHGRFARKITIPVNEIIKSTVVNTPMGLSHYILLEYGAEHFVSVQPENNEAFIEELRERQAKIDNGL